MAFGLGVLHLSPQSFWVMTLPELTAALTAHGVGGAGQVAMTRDCLDALMATFPDHTRRGA